jgi:hypothetical protein
MRTITTCVHCGAEFIASNRQHVYCSGACRTDAYRQRMGYGAMALDVRAWEGTAIQRRRSDGYVNATAMAKAGGKHLPHYMANASTKAYIAALAPVVGIPTTGIVDTIQGGTPELQGTWIHPRLAVDLARWISPAFAVWMDGWFLEVAAQGRTITPRPARPQRKTKQVEPAPPARRQRALTAAGPTRITWGDRVTLIGLAEHAREIDAAISTILRSGVLSE